ncbi:MAG: hypothetical protein ACLSHC_05170 [Bilophila wadsworthia]
MPPSSNASPTDALNSAAHSFKGDYGADDIAAARNSVSAVGPARVTQDMPRSHEKRGGQVRPLANQFATLNGAIQRGLGGCGLGIPQEGMTQFSLEGHAPTPSALMSREQKVDMGSQRPVTSIRSPKKSNGRMGSLSEFLNQLRYLEIRKIPIMLRSSPARTA